MSSGINSLPKLGPVAPLNIAKSSVASGSAKASGQTAAGQAKQVSVSSHGAGALASKWDMFPIQEDDEGDAHPAGELKSVATRQRTVQPYSVDEAAKMVTSAMRRNMGQNVQNRMLATGKLWQDTPHNTRVSDLSRQNLTNLSTRLQGPLLNKPLAPYERAFLKKMLDSPLHITHATNALDKIRNSETGTISLSSRQKLIRDGISFPVENTSAKDISDFANDDNVFFALESGETLQKPNSRFGKSVLRFDFDAPNVQQHATLHLFDLLAGLPPLRYRFDTLEKLPPNDRKAEIYQLERHEQTSLFDAQNTVFQAKDMKRGLALAILDRCRAMSPEVSQQLLEKEDVNALINGLFRPQVLVPRVFVSQPEDITDLTPPGRPSVAPAMASTTGFGAASGAGGAPAQGLTGSGSAEDLGHLPSDDDDDNASTKGLIGTGSAGNYGHLPSDDDDDSSSEYSQPSAPSSPTTAGPSFFNQSLAAQSGVFGGSSSSLRAPSDTDAADTLLEMMSALEAEDDHAFPSALNNLSNL